MVPSTKCVRCFLFIINMRLCHRDDDMTKNANSRNAVGLSWYSLLNSNGSKWFHSKASPHYCCLASSSVSTLETGYCRCPWFNWYMYQCTYETTFLCFKFSGEILSREIVDSNTRQINQRNVRCIAYAFF